jgi:hypothetical protein
LAAKLSLVAAPDSPDAGAGVGLEELVAGVELAGAGAVFDEEVLFEELPQPASTTTPSSTGTNARRLRTRRVFG